MISLLDLLRRIDAGELTPAAALRAAHDAIAAGDPAIEAFVHVDGAARAGSAGALRGIAVGIKDIIDTADMPTELGSPIYAGWRPKADAPVVAALKAAGATPVGKTATTAFAFLDPAPTRNPRNPAHTPGGSSAGSAAAVAAGLVPLAFGTQTGGSIIRPASYCGVAAVKPSFRLIPTVGVKSFSWALDTVGLFAASVADAAYALAAVTGRPDLRIDGRAGEAPRIGVVVAGLRRRSRAGQRRRARRGGALRGAGRRPRPAHRAAADLRRGLGGAPEHPGLRGPAVVGLGIRASSRCPAAAPPSLARRGANDPGRDL